VECDVPVPVGSYGEGLLTARVETQTDLLVMARAAHRGGDFETSYAAFSRAGAVGPLAVDDLDALAIAAGTRGHGREAMRVGELVYVRLTRTDPSAAAAKAVELGSAWLSRGEWAIGQSWIRRARGLLAGAPESPALVTLTCLETVVAVLTDDVELAAERSAVLREMSLVGTPTAVAGEAYYQLGEVRRRRGDVRGAFSAYARAHQLGVAPQPGEALLRCALGDVESARSAVQAALAVADSGNLPRLLRGAIQIALAAGDLDEAESHLRELESTGAVDNLLHGAVLVRRGRYREAVTVLQAALRESGYQGAEAYEWLAQAHRGLGTAISGR
jgi:tetratricopeptide (TPR) repeat protein